MTPDEVLIPAAISSWEQVVSRVGTLCLSCTEEQLLLLRYVLWTTRDPRFGAAISANSGPCEQEILDLTSRPRQGPPRSFFYYARFPG